MDHFAGHYGILAAIWDFSTIFLFFIFINGGLYNYI